MTRPTDDDLKRLLSDPRLTSVRLLRGKGSVVVQVSEVVDLALAGFGGDADSAEAALDEVVEELGGGKQQLTDLDNLTARAWARLRGKPSAPKQRLYEFPEGVLSAAPKPAFPRKPA